mmetsp:Transcript_28866/g.32373  ORF Transcript_28866/g.32373 Transcript_28866/m.32373 type:complete len:129 (+) Transcript_28866:131-517(+)|eukprot:CAMPEP_0170758552 /NCGR_PEP_ID=MMETSP0733-20121128/390_1 /TAXON_ID=186038 /ORGANISM="Fragilariopsis kerguelensis, Strain L26-C5" /LENGTH=128 /DNA_ID=CAMNT_0011097859 /DNA_START=73 /DNA_END=462 /DNA_ORIENTATION=+
MFTRILHFCLLIAACTCTTFIGHTEALQNTPPFSRRSFAGKLVTGTTGAIIIATSSTSPAWAADTNYKQQTGGKAVDTRSRTGPKSRVAGGKEMSDRAHNGTELDDKEAKVAGGLLDKMGLTDIKGAK